MKKDGGRGISTSSISNSMARALRGRFEKSLLFVLAALVATTLLPWRLEMGRRSASSYPSATFGVIHAWTSLMAPLLFPQLYPECGRIANPSPPADAVLSDYSQSQHEEDKILYDRFFSNYTAPGVFLEIGALDGVLYSNTFSFEHALGWRGILVEAQPHNGAVLRKANRSRAAVFTIAACQIPDLASPGELRFSKDGGPVATDLDHAAPSFLETWAGWLGEGHLPVPCIPLQYLIDATGLWDIDLFSLDVEGGERIVLETVDLERTNIRVLMVELDEHSSEKNEWVRQHLGKAGFENLGGEFMANKRNEVFVNPRFEERKATRPPLPVQCANG